MSQRDLHAFERLHAKLAAAPSRKEQRILVDEFLSGVTQTPLVSDEVSTMDRAQAVLLYRGRSGQHVSVLGDWNGYQEPGQPLAEISGSGLYFLTLTVEPDARLDYYFLVGSLHKPRLDPLNPLKTPGGYGVRSVLAMPAYQPPPELADTRPAPPGRLTRFQLRSRALNQRRSVAVYTPPSYPEHAPYPTVYLHDGGDYIRFAQLPAVADRLIAAGRVPPFVAVCLPPRNRVIEYDCNDAYVQFVAGEAVPAVERRFATDARPGRRAVMGASYGGLISLYIGLHCSDIFGLVGGQSSYASRNNNAILRAYASTPRLPLRFHLIAGTYERWMDVDDDEGDFLEANRHLAVSLRKRGYDVYYAEYPEGHSWGLWQAHLGDALEYFFT